MKSGVELFLEKVKNCKNQNDVAGIEKLFAKNFAKSILPELT